jgi:copper(I)-binding protein
MTLVARSRFPLPVLLFGGFAVAAVVASFAVIFTRDDAGAAFEPVKVGDLTISDAWVRATIAETPVTAAYLTVKNKGAADTLVRASAPIAGMVQLHETITEHGTAKMREKAGGFPVPANGTFEMKPGGYHIMLLDLNQLPAKGETVELTLTFERAGEVKIIAPVKVATNDKHDTGGYGHGAGMGGTPTPGGH